MRNNFITDTFEVVFTASSVIEAQRVKDLLESNGIVAYLDNEITAQRPEDAGHLSSVMVSVSLRERALDVLVREGYIQV